MKRQTSVNKWRDFKEGDVILGKDEDGYALVEREDNDPHPPGTMLEFTDGSKAFKVMHGYQGDRAETDVWLVLYNDGSKGYYSYEYIRLNFTVKGPESIKPQITREHFIKTLQETVTDNGLDLREGALNTLLVFAADRLGLR
jgi:hypothetical protein